MSQSLRPLEVHVFQWSWPTVWELLPWTVSLGKPLRNLTRAYCPARSWPRTPEHGLYKTISQCLAYTNPLRKKPSFLKRTELTLCIHLKLDTENIQLRVKHYAGWDNRDYICLLKINLCRSYRNLLASICPSWTLPAPSPLSLDQVLSASLSLFGRSYAAAWMPLKQEAMTGGCWLINSTWTGECTQASGPTAFI